MKLTTISLILLSATSTALSNPVERRQTYTPYFGNILELAYCLNPFNIAACLAAHGHAEVASRTAWDYFPDSLHNGQGDAFRHCYWNARMIIDIGATKAKTIADNHENTSTNPAAEKAMDLANNETGRGVGAAAAGATKEEKYTNAEAQCLSLANVKGLVTLE